MKSERKILAMRSHTTPQQQVITKHGAYGCPSSNVSSNLVQECRDGTEFAERVDGGGEVVISENGGNGILMTCHKQLGLFVRVM